MKLFWFAVGTLAAALAVAAYRSSSSSSGARVAQPVKGERSPEFVLEPLPKASALRPTFHGYACTQDCSGHEAGYEWAEENGITDPDDCGGKSESFIEGCKAFAEERSEAEEQGADGEAETADDEEAKDE